MLSHKRAADDHDHVRSIVRGAPFLIVAAATTLAVAMAACGGDDDGESATPTPSAEPASPTAEANSTPASPTATATAPQTTASSFNGTTSAVTAPASSAEVVTLKDVRVGTGLQYDTIVFEFLGAILPGYTVQFVDKVAACPSGSGPAPTSPPPAPTSPRGRGTPTAAPEPTLTPTPSPTPFGTVAGKAIISVQLNPAAPGDTLGRTDFRGGTGALAQATQVCTGSGVVSWVIGAKEKTSFRVTTLQDPSRIVIDIER